MRIFMVIMAFGLFSCHTPKYKPGEKLYVLGTEVTVVKAHSFMGTGHCGSAVYKVMYVTKTGEVIQAYYCESQLTVNK